jgi:hypothetical protein
MNKKIILLIISLILINIAFGYDVSSQTIMNDKTAYVNDKKAYIEQTPAVIDSNKEAKIVFKNKFGKDTFDICFDFEVSNTYIYFEYIEKKEWFGLLNKNLNNITREGNRICINSFVSGTQEEINSKDKEEYILEEIEINNTIFQKNIKITKV